jgi:prolyl oligopeptidase
VGPPPPLGAVATQPLVVPAAQRRAPGPGRAVGRRGGCAAAAEPPADAAWRARRSQRLVGGRLRFAGRPRHHHDGARVAVGRADAGSDWTTWSVVETATRTTHADRVPWSKFSGAAWLPDGSGFVYGAYEPPARRGARSRDPRHAHPAPPARDGCRPTTRWSTRMRRTPSSGFAPIVSHDGRWLVLHITRGTDPDDRRAGRADRRRRADRTGPHPAGRGTAQHEPVGVLGDDLVVLTDLDAPLGRIVRVDLRDGTLRQLVAEGADRLHDAWLAGAATSADAGWLVCHRLHHATSMLVVHPLADGPDSTPSTVPLPWPVTVTGLTTARTDPYLAVALGSFTAPDQLASRSGCPTWTSGRCGRRSRWQQPSPGRNRSPGTRSSSSRCRPPRRRGRAAVPVHRADVVPDGAAPRCCGATAGSTSRSPRCTGPRGARGWTPAGCSRSPACAAAGSTAARGTTPAGSPTSSTSSTTRWPAPRG